jgi:hypothetical protein
VTGPALCVIAAITAVTAAALGHHLTPSRRRARHARRQQEQARRHWAAKFDQVRHHVEGQIAVHGSETVWLRLLADHRELYTDQPHGGT